MRPVAQLRSRRDRHPRVGRLVQQPPPARTHRQHLLELEGVGTENAGAVMVAVGDPPAEAEARYYAQINELDMVA